MVDPVVVCSAPAPDLFLHQTSAAWTAVGSIVSALSVIALAIFNVIYFYGAHTSRAKPRWSKQSSRGKA